MRESPPCTRRPPGLDAVEGATAGPAPRRDRRGPRPRRPGGADPGGRGAARGAVRRQGAGRPTDRGAAPLPAPRASGEQHPGVAEGAEAPGRRRVVVRPGRPVMVPFELHADRGGVMPRPYPDRRRRRPGRRPPNRYHGGAGPDAARRGRTASPAPSCGPAYHMFLPFRGREKRAFFNRAAPPSPRRGLLRGRPGLPVGRVDRRVLRARVRARRRLLLPGEESVLSPVAPPRLQRPARQALRGSSRWSGQSPRVDRLGARRGQRSTPRAAPAQVGLALLG